MFSADLSLVFGCAGLCSAVSGCSSSAQVIR